MKISIINGPNFKSFGYSRALCLWRPRPFEAYHETLQMTISFKCSFDYFQSNVEGELINRLHEVGFSSDAVLTECWGLHAHLCGNWGCD